MFRKIIILGLITAVALSVAACSSNKKIKKKTSASPKIKAEIMKDAKKDIAVIQETRDDANKFDQALSGQALKDFKGEHENNLKEGKIKVRSYSEAKISFVDLAKGLATITFNYVDDSYFVSSAESSKAITQPQGKPKEILLHLKKIDGKWKIVLVSKLESKESK